MRNLGGRARQALSLLVLLGLWAVVSSAVGREVLPGPSDVAVDLWDLVVTGDFAEPLGRSLVRVAFGFALGFSAGVGYGILAARSIAFSRITGLLTLILLFSPTLVVIFVGILLLGTSDVAGVVITGLLVFPSIGIYIRDVMKDVDGEVLAMATSYKVGRVDKVFGIYVPYLAPSILSASRMGFAHAWKIVFLTEVFGLTGGLGFEVRQMYGIFNLSMLIAWLVVFILVMLAFEQLIEFVERRGVRWQE